MDDEEGGDLTECEAGPVEGVGEAGCGRVQDERIDQEGSRSAIEAFHSEEGYDGKYYKIDWAEERGDDCARTGDGPSYAIVEDNERPVAGTLSEERYGCEVRRLQEELRFHEDHTVR